jgi:hypothetical protein
MRAKCACDQHLLKSAEIQYSIVVFLINLYFVSPYAIYKLWRNVHDEVHNCLEEIANETCSHDRFGNDVDHA